MHRPTLTCTCPSLRCPHRYEASDLHARNTAKLAELCQPKPGSRPLHFRRTYVRGVCAQLPIVVKRQMLAAWRNTGLNCTCTRARRCHKCRRMHVACTLVVARLAHTTRCAGRCDGDLVAVTRLVIFIVLALAFGLLFNNLDWTSDRAGVNSLNACVGQLCRGPVSQVIGGS